jgi:hypothetical protein
MQKIKNKIKGYLLNHQKNHFFQNIIYYKTFFSIKVYFFDNLFFVGGLVENQALARMGDDYGYSRILQDDQHRHRKKMKC